MLSLSVQAQHKRTPRTKDLPPFDSVPAPAAPDYSLGKNWAALPFREDAADATPRGVEQVDDSLKQVDVFYIHPTTYRVGNTWNADLNNEAENKTVDEKPVKYQASAWNGSCRVYAPRYRQAILQSFFTTDRTDGDKALDLAYEDVKNAFQYYLDHYNNGRPIVIASHSQGSRQARRLIKEFFDNGPLRGKLVCAYIVGFPVFEKDYQNIKKCTDETRTGCIVSWASYRDGFEPKRFEEFYKGAINTNPITWKTDTISSTLDQHKGMVLLNFNKLMKHRATARIHNDILWVKVKYPFVNKYDNLHIADINLFWADIREDVKKRVGYYWKH
jgi:hypothetical protein